MSAPLRLMAADPADLEVLSAAAQDAVFAVEAAQWLPSLSRFTVQVQRFRWEVAAGLTGRVTAKGERVLAALSFDRVLRVRARKVAQARGQAFASLLSVAFEASDAPSGTVTLNLADGGAIALDVECIDAILADLGPPREAVAAPEH